MRVKVVELFSALHHYPDVIDAIASAGVLFEDSAESPIHPPRVNEDSKDAIVLTAHQPVGIHVERLREALDEVRHN